MQFNIDVYFLFISFSCVTVVLKKKNYICVNLVCKRYEYYILPKSEAKLAIYTAHNYVVFFNLLYYHHYHTSFYSNRCPRSFL